MRPLPSASDLPPLSNEPSLPSTLLGAEETTGKLALGDWVGPYKIIRLLGIGGMGAVYEAEQETPIRRAAALKIIKPGINSAQIVARFEAERQTLARMNHENIAQLFEAGATGGGLPYFAMELIRGDPIAKYCDKNRLTTREKLALFLSVCRAIQYTHRQGVIHRDLKPSNILVTLQDGKPTPKIIDFGIARATEDDRADNHLRTEAGTIIGTLAYMAPEQAEMGPGGVTTLADVYSLGTICFELLTGTLPFDLEGKMQAEMVRILREEEPRLLRSLDASLSRDLEAIVAKALEKDERRRYQSAAELAADLERYLNDEPVQARPSGIVRNGWKYAKRHKIKAVAAGAAIAVLGVAAGLTAWAVLEKGRADAAEKDKKHLQTVADLKEQERVRREAEGFAEAGRQAARQGQWRAATTNFDRALQAGHADPAALRLGKARAHLALNEDRLCAAEIEALAQSPQGKEHEGAVLLLRGEMRLGQNDAEAERFLRAALTKNLSPAEEAYAQALLAEKTPKAVERFRQVLALDPYHYQARVNLELLLILLAQFEPARNELHAHRAMFPDDAELHLLRMLLFALEGNRNEAAAALANLKHRLDADDVKALEKLAEYLSAFRNSTKKIDPTLGLPDLGEEWQAVQPALRHLWPALAASGNDRSLPPPRLPLFSRLPPLLRKNLERMPSIFLSVVQGNLFELMRPRTIEETAWAAEVHPEGTVVYLQACALFGARRWEQADRAAEQAAAAPALLPVHPGALNVAASAKGMLYVLFRTRPDPLLPRRAVEAFALHSRPAFFAEAAAHGLYFANRQTLLPRALANLRELLAQNQRRPPIRDIAVNVAGLAGDFSLARQLLDDWEREAPGDLDALRLRVITERKADALLPALKAAEAYLQKKPNDAEMRKFKKDLVDELNKRARPYAPDKTAPRP